MVFIGKLTIFLLKIVRLFCKTIKFSCKNFYKFSEKFGLARSSGGFSCYCSCICQVSRRINDERNQRYCEKCIVIGSQSHKIVHETEHEYGKFIKFLTESKMNEISDIVRSV